MDCKILVWYFNVGTSYFVKSYLKQQPITNNEIIIICNLRVCFIEFSWKYEIEKLIWKNDADFRYF